MKLAPIAYRFVNGGGCVNLDNGGDSITLVERHSPTTPRMLKRLAARRLRALADRLENEAGSKRANRSHPM